MNQTEWLEYFEAINGRQATAEEMKEALAKGEFQEMVEEEIQEPLVDLAQPQAAPSPTQQIQTDQKVTGDSTREIKAEIPSAPYPAQPSKFKMMGKDFWEWLLFAWKNPLSLESVSSSNGYIAFGTLVVLTTLTIFLSAYHVGRAATSGLDSLVNSFSGSDYHVNNPVDFTAFFVILVVVALFIFSLILGGFLAKRMIYQENEFTLKKAFDYYGRLFSINIILSALAAIFALLGVLQFVGFLFCLILFIFLVSAAFAIARSEGKLKLNPFYQYILAVLVSVIIVLVFSYIEKSLVSNYISMLFQF